MTTKMGPSMMVLLFLISSHILPGFTTAISTVNSLPIIKPTQHTSTSPVTIVGNEEVGAFASAGNGSPANPYIISNYRIESSDYCLRLENISDYVVISDSYFSGDTTNLMLENVSNLLLDNTTLEGGEYGVYAFNVSNVALRDCTMAGNTNGVYFGSSRNATVESTRIYGGLLGIESRFSANLTVRQNKVYGHSFRGIFLNTGTTNSTVFGNEIGWNSIANAKDDGSDNIWWSEQEGGNLWSNYDGEEIYEIEGTAGSVDEAPSYLADLQGPQVEGPDDAFVVQNETDIELMWITQDNYPLVIQIYIDDEEQENQTWIPPTFFMRTGNLDIGTHNFTLIFSDASGNSFRDVVLITVTVSIFGGLGTTILLVSSILSVVGVIVVIFVLKKSAP